MSEETIKALQRKVTKLQIDLKHERERYIELYKRSLEVSSDFMKYTEKYPNHDPDDDTDAFNLNNKKYDDIVSFVFD